MKSRFTILDVAAMATELQPLVGLRLANLYDTASAKTFLLKFAKTDVKTLVLVESGVRVHTTAYARERDKDLKMPSHFIAKLRKHLKTRRLVAVKQLGADRILHLAFESYHLFVELYSSGNIILTDAEFVILAVLRVVDVETNAISAAITEPIAPTPTTADPTPADAAPQTAHDKVEINFRIGQRYTMVDFEKPYVSQDPRPAIEKAIAEFKLTLSKPVAPVEAPIEIVADEVETAAPATSKKGGKKAAATQKKKDKRMQKEATASKDSSITLRKWAKERFSASYGPALVDHAVSFERAKHRKLQNETAEGNSSAKFAIDPSLKMRDIVDDLELERVVVEGLVSGFCDANRILELIFSGSLKCEGWVTQIEHKNPSTGLASEEAAKDALITYDEFHPYLFAHLDTSESSTQMKHFTSFATCVDEFFTHAESQRLQLRLHQAETSATKKIENMSKNHAAQVNRLQTTCVASAAVAATIEYHLETVEAVIATVRTCVARGMDWVELWDLIKEEKRAGNHVAAVIDGLRLDVGMVTVSLMDASYEEEESDDDDSDEDDDDISSDDDGDNAADASSKRAALGKKKAELAKKRKEAEERRRAAMVKIDLDIYLSAYANARRYYDSKKVAAVKGSSPFAMTSKTLTANVDQNQKRKKTISAVSKALKQAEKKINQELKATQNSAPLIRTIRTQYWFEKFIWFVTSENYLVVAGRDPAQTDLLLRRYMKKDDVCVSADVEGAPIALVLNSFSSRGTQSASQQGSAPPGLTKEAPIPPLTLHQAGTLCVVHSRAWEAKIVTSAWWVRGETVMMHGGVAPILKGEKNYLPPVQLIYGFGLLFLVDEASAARHYDDRRPWARLGGVSNIVEEDGTQVADIADEEVGEVSGENDSESDSDTAEKHAEEKSDEPAVNFDKYNLAKPSPAAEANIDPVVDDGHEKGGDEDQDEASSKRPAVKGAKKRISAKERRQMKKGGKPEEPVSSTTPTATGISEPSHAVSEHEDETDEETEEHASISLMKSGAKSPASIASKESGAKSVASSVKPLPRGKKAKLKKMKDKYADQSDEEKEVMMTLLHGSDKKDEKEKEKQKDSDAHKKGGQQKQAGGKGNLNHPKPAGHKPKANVVGSLEFKGDAEDVDLSVLDALTSQPLTDDVLLACIPVCAPWTCLSKYKYKIKLIPGSLKKGKAAKSAESTFKTMMAKNGDKRETDVLVNIPETEYIAAILGKVKMTGAAGGNDGKKKT
ncbi:hypothetical protein BJ741DRAFT_591541 [Chytriomyces cf. hyalinus JEL632]|nr:hypothetical protein BJ741DRAFT_591541 [Chytriomyces cf. hyalinus JEL632]